MAIPVQRLPDVQTRPTGAPQVSVDTRGAFGESVAHGLGQLGQAAGELGSAVAAYKDKADTAWVLDAEEQFHQAASQQETRVLTEKGRTAASVSADASAQIDKARQKLLGSANNEEQARLFALRTGRIADTYHRSIERHVAGQIDDAEKVSAESIANGNLTRIGAAYNDPDRVEALTIEAATALRKRLAPYDDPNAEPGQKASEIAEAQYRKKAAVTVLNGYLGAKDDAGARAAFSALKPVLGEDAPAIEQHLNLLEQQQTAYRTSQKILANPANLIPGTKLPDMTKVGAALQAEKIADAETYAKTRALLNGEIHDAHVANDQRNAVLFDNGLAAVNRGEPVDASILAALNARNNEGGAKLAAELLDKQDQKSRKEETRPATADDFAIFGNTILEMREHPDRIVGMNVSDLHASAYDGGASLASRLPPKLLAALDEEFMRIQTAMNGPDRRYVAPYVDQRVRQRLKFPGGGKKPSDQQIAQYGIITAGLAEQERAWRAGGHPRESWPLPEVDKAIDGYLAQGEVLDSGTFLNSTASKIEVQTRERYAGKVWIPKDRLAEVDAAIAQRKKEGKLTPTFLKRSKDDQRAAVWTQLQAMESGNTKPPPPVFHLSVPGSGAPAIGETAPEPEPPTPAAEPAPPRPLAAHPPVSAAPAPVAPPPPARTPGPPPAPEEPTYQEGEGPSFGSTFFSKGGDASAAVPPAVLPVIKAWAEKEGHGADDASLRRAYSANPEGWDRIAAKRRKGSR